MTYFNAPQHSADLRVVTCAQTMVENGFHQLAWYTQSGEYRALKWLTKADAHSRAKLLKARGYRVTVSTMGI